MKALVASLFFLAPGAMAIGQTVDNPITFNLSYDGNGERLEIYVNIGDGTPAEPYLFDTGSSPFTSAWADGVAWWPAGTTAGTPASPIIYGPGSGENMFEVNHSTQSVTASAGGGTLSGILQVDQITAAYTNNPSNTTADWQPNTKFNGDLAAAVTDPSIHPYQGKFNGDMGADLANITTGGGFAALVNGQTYGNGLKDGFIVNGSLSGPTVTVGLTASTIASFTNTYAMNVSGGVIQQRLINGNYVLTNGSTTVDFSNVPTLLDTGTPPSTGLNLLEGSTLTIPEEYLITVDGYMELSYGTSFTMLIGDTPYTLTSTEDDPIYVYVDGNGIGGITYGLNFFQNYEVMYDLADDIVGIAAVPEPSQYGPLAALVLAGLMAWRRRTFPRSQVKLGNEGKMSVQGLR